MSSGHYRANVRDLEFNLFEMLGLDALLDRGAFGALDSESVRTMLDEMRRMAEGPLGASFADADRHPPVFDPATHTVALPDAFKRSYRALRELGWEKIGVATELGGTPVPRAVYWALGEMVLGAPPPPRKKTRGARGPPPGEPRGGGPAGPHPPGETGGGPRPRALISRGGGGRRGPSRRVPNTP
ncbi:acyl-CoA dehydrogenase family protein, partial [Nocardia abscessus]|uniref:acyl-CoA dehydrogenase N-terminal domain-containing protein n=1 Tax=Nocardia abscessus TaxID=120957 RepID=UPI003CC7D4FC